MQEQLAGARPGVTHRVALELAHDQLGLVVAVDRLDRAVVVLDVLGVDDHLDVGRVVELSQLQRGELRLCRAASGEHVDLAHRAGRQPAVDVVRDLGDQQLVGGLGQHPRDVQSDVAGSDDGDLLRVQRPHLGDIGVAVEPGHEVGAAEAAVLVDARDVEVAVLLGARGEHHGVVVAPQVVELDVHAVLDVAQQAHLGLAQDLVQRLDDALDAGVVRGDAVADETEWRRLALEQVDRHGRVGLHEHVGGVDAGRARTDDRDPERALGRAHGRRCRRLRTERVHSVLL